MNKRQQAAELRRAVQLFLATLDAESQSAEMLAVASAFPAWRAGAAYKAGEVLRYGENAAGDAQLYQVLQEHAAAEEWTPDPAVSLYKPVGVTEDGVPVWVQPLGTEDAYGAGDRVSHQGKLWVSELDGNVWEPGVYGWTETDV